LKASGRLAVEAIHCLSCGTGRLISLLTRSCL